MELPDRRQERLGSQQPAHLDFHKRVYGADFPYQNFAPMFKAELFDPARWAETFERFGRKVCRTDLKASRGFCVVAKCAGIGHVGTALERVEIGPQRDLLGDLTRPCGRRD